MDKTWGDSRIHPAWWTAILAAAVITAVLFTAGMFTGTFRTFVPVLLTSDRSGLVMESGAKVKMRGVEVGQVSAVAGGQPVRLQLDIYPDQIQYIPANVQPQIRATNAFGSKFVDLVYPTHPQTQRLAAGAVLESTNVSTEVTTVFENLVSVLKQIDPPKLNAVLSALAEGVRGKGQAIGEATTDADQLLTALNARAPMIQRDFKSAQGFTNAYSAAAKDIVSILDAASTTSNTITEQATSLDTLLLSAIGLARTGTDILGSNRDNLTRSINQFETTADLLLKYNPEYTCLLQGAKWYGDHAVATGTNGRTSIVDAGLALSQDMYKYPDNLPVVAAKGGPGGKPGCGSLPDASKNFPVRYMVTNTGWGTGLDIRPNPGIPHPWYADYFPATRAVPEPPTIRGLTRPPGIGPVPYPGAPPYGAPLFGPDGTPLWAPPPPGVPPPPVPGTAVPAPPYGPAPDAPPPPP